MGLGSRRPTLPAPTDSLIDSGVEETGVSTDIATDLSRRTDRTSATIPDDGSPVTISTGVKASHTGKHTKNKNPSQTSLLIEYYEGNKEPGSNRRPSLRVRVRPSAGKGKEASEGYLAVTREQGSRKASHTQRIPLGARSPNTGTESVSSLGSGPVDIEIEGKRSDVSEMSASPEARYIVAPSDISSMPPDSMLGTTSRIAPVPLVDTTSSILTNSELDERSELKPPIFPRERNLSHEKITQRAMEKLNNRDRESSTSLLSEERSRQRSGSGSHDLRGLPVQERRRKAAKFVPTESSVSGGTGSIVSESVLSAAAKSIDEKSVRSGTSNITNPKLLQTVEDAIRRLILPELKEIKRNGSQRVRTQDEYYSDVSDNSIAREKASARRVSSGTRSKRRASKESGSDIRRRHRHRDQDEYESPSEISSHQRESVSSISAERDREHRSRSGDKGVRTREVAAATLVGGALTAAALQHQDSSSTLERRRRRKRSKSHSSRSASIAEDEDAFEKHAVPPMPFRSEIGSEVTRSSLLSSNTADTATPTQNEVRQVVRGASFDTRSPVESIHLSNTGDLRHSLGTHHRNISGHDLTAQRNSYEETMESQSIGEYSPEMYHDPSFPATGLLDDPERMKAYERNLHQQHPIRRGLSPIQSIASYTTEPHRHSGMYTRSMDSISSLKRQQELKEEVSVDSFMSASPSVQKHGRPHGISLENRSEIMHQHDDVPRHHDETMDDFYEEQHHQNDQYRTSYASNDPKIDVRHLTNYTDDSMDLMHRDKAISGQHVNDGFASNPEYIHTPPGVESAVASLIEPSLLDAQTVRSPHRSATDLLTRESVSANSTPRDIGPLKSPSPVKEHLSVQSPESVGKPRHLDNSPPQSISSFNEHQQEITTAPKSENKSATSPESEITTNPSIIHGPIGGLSGSNRDHWPYAPTPDRAMPNNPAQQALSRDLGAHAPDLVPKALNLDPLNLSQRGTYSIQAEAYDTGDMTPPGAKDEGYATGDNPRSPGLYAKQNMRAAAYTPDELEDDPFVSKRNKYMSGLSQKMSPLYDSATGKGIEQIQSKDVVALMDHLTVRDAQRNARDTEILVTLVRSAAEMRNSFEDMKKFIAEQDGLMMTASEKQHEKTQRIIGGPRPQPVSTRTKGRPITLPEEEDIPTKRKNIFKRALQGLGSKNASELHNIEQMLMQLLDDVEDLRELQIAGNPSSAPAVDVHRTSSLVSVDHTRAPTDTGYEPEGMAGTSSSGDRSGNLSNQSSRHDYRSSGAQRDSVNRVSTVLEGDEEAFHDNHEDHNGDAPDNHNAAGKNGGINRYTALASHQVNDQYLQARGESMPPYTPKTHDSGAQPWSNDNNIRSATDPTSQRKNKSVTSAFFPKLMSRWSKTTASTDAPRFSVQTKSRPYSQISRSGSDLADYSYEPQPEDRLRSNTSLNNEHYRDQENRPPSPLVPSQVSNDPKYHGYRNSKNLEHPQPRQGPTGRYQSQLEHEAQNYYDGLSPTSQTSSAWEAQYVGHDPNKPAQDRYQPQPPLSPISDGGYSATSSIRRQHRMMDDDPLVPQRPAKVPMSPSNYVDHVAAARSGSPAYDKSPVAALRSSQGSGRKPSGPRPYHPSSQNDRANSGDLSAVKKTRFRGSPYHISSSEDLSRASGI